MMWEPLHVLQGHELALHVLYQLYAEQASEEGNFDTSSPISIAYGRLLTSLVYLSLSSTKSLKLA